jgi:hypothetical protein
MCFRIVICPATSITQLQVPLSFYQTYRRCQLSKQITNPNTPTFKMQFSVVSIIAALAAVSSAQYLAPNATAPYPSGTGSPSGTGAVPSSTAPFNNGAAVNGASGMVVLAVGAAALVSQH